ncbi:MAG TPA: AAA family ATPase [Gaiellaceae bacterium]|nr:AAA family ATPase [Gaiellaceae bacterium]
MTSPAEPTTRLPGHEANRERADQWRRLRRAATAVALLTSPAAFVWFHERSHMSILWSLMATAGTVIAFRGILDLLLRRMIPWPSLFGTDDRRLRDDDVVARRREWFWHRLFRFAVWIAFLMTVLWIFRGGTWWGQLAWLGDKASSLMSSPQFWIQIVFAFSLFFMNFAILLGPMLAMTISQIRGYEPGDAEWGVKLEDVRGQAEAKEEVRRVVSLWQSGEAFEKAGGKRERGLLFLGAPGTGKTMLAKAIATGFNSPFVSIPGSGFAATFIGIDVIIVRFLVRKAKKLAAKWGGNCIVFIDEIDAVGMRRQALQGGAAGGRFGASAPQIEDYFFYGPNGALTPSGDLVLETRAWRERLFAERGALPPAAPNAYQRIVNQVFPGMFGGGMGGGMALNQLLVAMDGIDNPPFLRRFFTSRINNVLDAVYIVPTRIGKVRLRIPPPRPRKEQIYFVGATNVQLEVLDPALIRPGRMGRHVWFRTPTKEDRKDIFDLYLGKVGHDPELDTEHARDELARMTNGYSPAMIDQVCSMALTYAQHDGRLQFARDDIVEAMTTIESGTAVGVEYTPSETRSVAIHEAGHAAVGHVYMKSTESTRLSIKMRGGSLGHHQAMEKEERFSAWRSEDMARLAWTLGAMAAEHVFYGENSRGVGGDVQSATGLAALMVGAWGMAPPSIPGQFADETPEQTREREEGTAMPPWAQMGREQFADETPWKSKERAAKQLQRIGKTIMNRTSGGLMAGDPVSAALSDPEQKNAAAQMLGLAFVTAYNLVRENKEQVERIADVLVQKRELHGDEVLKLLDAANLKAPEIDLAKDEQWPNL